MSKDLDWVDYFDQAYYNAVVHGTGFIRVSVNGPEGLNLSVVDPKDYRYLMEEPPSTWVGLTDDDRVLIKYDANFNQFMTAGEYADRVQALTEARLKDLNT